MPTVMIAEDDLMISEMMRDFLEDAGYEVCGIASTVAGAVALGERHQPDLAILDLRLADGGLGTEIVARLGRSDTLGILYATANAGGIALSAGDGDARITKPYSADEMIRALKIVEEIVSTGVASPPFPRGFQLLGNRKVGRAAQGSSHGR
jgi:DNA-binding response OmpR family regulator